MILNHFMCECITEQSHSISYKGGFLYHWKWLWAWKWESKEWMDVPSPQIQFAHWMWMSPLWLWLELLEECHDLCVSYACAENWSVTHASQEKARERHKEGLLGHQGESKSGRKEVLEQNKPGKYGCTRSIYGRRGFIRVSWGLPVPSLILWVC